MKVSVNWIKQFVDFELPPVDELVQKIGAQLGAVEEVADLGQRYQGIVVVKVVACDKHSNADKLSVCKIDDGGKAKDVERDNDNLVQVVCGAPNVRAGMLAVWLPPGVTVPITVDKEPFAVEARELRGVVSNGMLASPKELAIGDSHEGLLEIDKGQPGDDFAQLFKLDDSIVDIENKMFTHRPDCFGALGVAREIAGVRHRSFKSPEWYAMDTKLPEPNDETLPLTVTNEVPELAPRFTVVTIGGVKVGPSPTWLQVALSKIGQKPINNIVDLTNFYMLVTGQPLHAYDYDKLKALSGGEAALVVRNPKPAEKIKLLNGKEIEPRAEAVMIATDKQLIGIGGVMGGTETEVDENTKNIILECANFDMYSIRRTSMAHGLFTDAVTRFTKGQSPLQCRTVLAKTVADIQKLTGGQVAGSVIDDNHIDQTVLERGSLYEPVKVTTEFINVRLGLELSADEMKQLLENVEFQVDVTGNELTVKAPFWRTDIELREDIVEEVGRLYGYDHLPLMLPKRDLTPTRRDPLLDLKATIRDQLSKAGANEVLTYSFVHGDLLEKAGQDKQQAFQISSALSPDLQYYRMSLTPSLLEKVHPNIKAGYDQFALFELGKAHVTGELDQDDTNVPKEVNALSFVYAAKGSQTSAPYYIAKKYLMSLLSGFQLRQAVSLEPLENADLYKNPWIEQMTAPFEPHRSAVLRDEKGLIWGVVGEFKASVRKALKLSSSAAGFEIDPLLLTGNYSQTTQSYVSLPRFPKLTQDITLKVSADLTYQELFDFTWNEVQKSHPKNTLAQLDPRDIFQRDEDKEHKQITFRLEIASYERTLTDSEVNKLLDQIAGAAKTKFGAERI
jgi:phenylalanyl-tRNA synthetase beta chain